MIGIVLPAYNAETTIENTLNSIINQTYENWTLFIINDGSTDDTEKIIKSYKDERINYILKHNSGASETRNDILMSVSLSSSIRYSFIAFCDADHIWDETHLEESISQLESTNSDICYCNVRTQSESGEPLSGVNITEYSSFNIDNLKKSNFIYISSVVCKFSTIIKVGEFDDLCNSLEDYDYWIRCVKEGFKFTQKQNSTVTYVSKQTRNTKHGNAILPYLQLKHKDFLIQQNLPIKLNLGCGDQLLDGYINCDLHSKYSQQKFDASKLPYPDNSVDEIAAYHLIEHFLFQQAFDVLKEWNRVLKPGGKLILETPDFFNNCKKFVDYPDMRIELYSHFFAWPHLPGQTHYFLYTEDQLKWTLSECGFNNIQRVAPDSIYAYLNPEHPDLYLKVIAEKIMSEIKYSIIIPTYNHLDDCLKHCIESIIKYTDLSNCEVIIVANGCTDRTKNYLESLKSPFKHLWFDETLGYAKATNEGIKIAQGEFIIFLNNDTQLLEQPKDKWLNELMRYWNSSNNPGCVGPHSLICWVTKRKFIIFFCAMTSRKVLDDVGILDESFSPGSGEDVDYCIRCEDSGYAVISEKDFNESKTFPIFHKGEMTAHDTNLVEGREEVYERNQEKLKLKYLDKNQKILNKLKLENKYLYRDVIEVNEYDVKEDEVKNRIVIDVGANWGYFSIFVSQLGAKKIYAFEPDPENYKKLVENVKDIVNIIPINKAIHKKDIKKCSLVNNNVMCRTTINSDENDIDCISLREVFADIKENVILKIDCEGGEYDIFLDCDREEFDKIDIIYAEFHDPSPDEKEYSIDFLKNYIIKNNFKESDKKINYESGFWYPNDVFIPVDRNIFKTDIIKFKNGFYK